MALRAWRSFEYGSRQGSGGCLVVKTGVWEVEVVLVVTRHEKRRQVLLIEKSSGDKLADGPSAVGASPVSGAPFVERMRAVLD